MPVGRIVGGWDIPEYCVSLTILSCIIMEEMNPVPGLIKTLNPNYFWDVDFDGLDPHSARRLIVERIFNLGTLNEIRRVNDFYGKVQAEVLVKLTYIDPKTCNFVKKMFRIPLSKFRCRTREQLKKQHWNS